MRLKRDSGIPNVGAFNYENSLNLMLRKNYEEIVTQVNNLTEGMVSAVQNADTAAPTAGNYNQGDFVRNKTPSELGSGGSKYVIMGWLCVTSGTPGTWVQCRALTGN